MFSRLNFFNKKIFKNKNSRNVINNGANDSVSSTFYFGAATEWAEEVYGVMEASRNRYKTAFLLMTGLSVLLTLSVLTLSHTHEYIPLMVHHYDSGAVSVQPMKPSTAPNQAEIESELVRYVINRESYDPASFSQQYSLVTLMSDRDVAHQYQHQQSAGEKTSFINQWGNNTVRSVQIEVVNFLDQEQPTTKGANSVVHKNLAEISFMVIDRNISSGKEKKTPYVAIVAWTHLGIPEDPEARWQNWDGFIVTSYHVNQRTVS